MEHHRGPWGSRASAGTGATGTRRNPRHGWPVSLPWGTLSPRTDAPLAATLIPIAWALFTAPWDGLVAGRRPLPRPQLLASRGVHSIAGTGLRTRKPSPIPPATFVSDDEAKYTRSRGFPALFPHSQRDLSTALAQSFGANRLDRCISRWKSWHGANQQHWLDPPLYPPLLHGIFMTGAIGDGLGAYTLSKGRGFRIMRTWSSRPGTSRFSWTARGRPF